MKELNVKELKKMWIDFFESHHDQSFSAEEIINQLKNDEISISAVYRNLAELEKDGKIRKNIKSGNRKIFYQFVDCDECKGHLHLTCTKCGKTEHLPDADSNEIVKSVLQNSNFNLDSDAKMNFKKLKSLILLLSSKKSELMSNPPAIWINNIF